MIQLLLETATDVCSVAVARDGIILAEKTASEAHRHSSHLTLFIGEVMASAKLEMHELNEVLLSDGPGSYTSLRVGAATAKGLCLALPGLHLRVQSTLEALAVASGINDGVVLATINSRRGEVFGQLFGAQPQVPGSDEEAKSNLWMGPQNIRLTEEDWYDQLIKTAGTSSISVVGGGQDRVLEHLPSGVTLNARPPLHCSAVHLLAPATPPAKTPIDGAASSRLVDVASYEPFYLNPPFVTKSKKKLLGR